VTRRKQREAVILIADICGGSGEMRGMSQKMWRNSLQEKECIREAREQEARGRWSVNTPVLSVMTSVTTADRVSEVPAMLAPLRISEFNLSELNKLEENTTKAPLPTYLPLIERQKRKARREHLALFALATLGLLTLGYRVGKTQSAPAPSAPVIEHVVQPGDNLWKIAERYGNPNVYILARVADVENLNPKIATRPLQVGDSVRVHVENPVLVAQMSRRLALR
jgi:LysM repeat protein